jgi:3-hydroxyacyl-CoA dehydrogenase
MAEIVTYARQGAVGVIAIDNPPVNALGAGVRKGLVDCLKQGNEDPDAAALVLIGGGRTFPAGADITEFGKPPAPPTLSEVIAAYENSAKPVVAALHGTALGGGLELALGCDWRCATKDARLGLPEVKLGILPGAGGTQRLPRLIGAQNALEVIVGGDFVAAPKALEWGLIDEIVSGDLPAGAIAFAERIVAEERPRRRIRDMEVSAPPELFEGFRETIAKKQRGFIAPLRCIESVENVTTLPFDEGLAAERAMFLELVASPQAEAQRYMFFAEREVAKVPGVDKDTPLRRIASVGIVGVGTMGGGIAMNFANAGIPVTLVEAAEDALDRGFSTILGNYAASVDKGHLTQKEADDRTGRLTGSLHFDDLSKADLVIEAAFEDMALKKEIFAKLDAVCRPGAILATNTSTLDINEIASVTGRPQDVVGMHFFSPANVMKLLEIVRGDKTAADVLASVMRLCRTISKIGVVVGVCDGFVGNRMLHAYWDQAYSLILEGALPQQVDKALYDWGWAMGPFAVMDLAGTDVSWRVRQAKAERRDRNKPYPAAVADRLCEKGRYGRKTGAGWYRYEEASRTPLPDPEVETLILEASADMGFARREIADDEIVERCLYALLNEGARILAEGVAERAGDIDVIYHYGYGFPRYRGGPLFCADEIGLEKVLAGIRAFDERQPGLWSPAPLIVRLAGEGKGFRDL